jgi:LacI family transcriptional regulator
MWSLPSESVPGQPRMATIVLCSSLAKQRTANKMNIREIAERARVSAATVSRVVNCIPTVNRKLAKRVWNTVGELGYSPNRQARGLVSGKSRILGLVVSAMTDPFSPEIIQSFETHAVQRGYEILVTSTLHDPKRIELSARRMIERRIEGVAVLTFGSELLVEILRAQGIPLVYVDVEPCFSKASAVRIDYGHGIRQTVQHLAALRHERIGYVTGPSNSKTASAKRSAFEKCIAEIGLRASSELIFARDDTVEGGMSTFTYLAQLRNRPTAIICSNDMTAVGVMRRSYELGFAVPQDLSVVGFDDIPLARFINPPLTTVRVPQAELGRLAFHALISEVDRAEHETSKPKEYVLSTDLVLRRSTALALPRGAILPMRKSLVVESSTEDPLMQRAGHDQVTIARL